MTEVGEYLERHREPSGMSVRGAAKAAGLSEARWRQIVSGRQRQAGVDVPVNPKASTIVKMATAVGADVRTALDLAGFDPSDAPPPPQGADVDPELLAGLSPDEVQRVVDFIRGIKAGRT